MVWYRKENLGFAGFTVYATTEESQINCTGGWFDTAIPQAALPDKSAVGKFIEVFYPVTGKSITVPVTDLGPWYISDDYWNITGVPRVVREPEAPTYSTGLPATNPSGLDLSVGAWLSLGVEPIRARSLLFSDYVIWRFLI